MGFFDGSVDFQDDNVLAGQAFAAARPLVTLGVTTEVPFVLFRNPAGSGKLASIYLFTCSTNNNNVFTTLRLYKTPTVTANGTAMTAVNQRIGNANTSVMLPTSAPTTSANGTLIDTYYMAQNQSTLLIKIPGCLVIEANQAILFTAQQATNGMLQSLGVYWTEE